MEKNAIIVEMTPFLFEDGKTYYFDIRKRHTNSYHDLFVYNKIDKVTERKTWFGFGPTETKVTTEYKCINYDNGSLVSIELHSKEIKNEIKNIIISNQAVTKIKDWDGFVGDIPADAKKALARESKLNDLGIK
jgi:hypothetical protein